MTEGGLFAWKIQKLNLAPTLTYDSIQKPLKAPKGRQWIFDPVHKEWSLEEKEETSSSVPKTLDSPYIEHIVTSSDTFQGICLRYKIKPLELRRLNGGFTGENLSLVPNPLKIPRRKDMTIDKKVDDAPRALTQDEVVGILLKECRSMNRSEARAYLMLNDWDFAKALENACEDGF